MGLPVLLLAAAVLLLAVTADGRWATASPSPETCVTETTTVTSGGEITEEACVGPGFNVLEVTAAFPPINAPTAKLGPNGEEISTTALVCEAGCGVDCDQDCGDPILLHSGEFFSYTVDLEIPGRGFNWQFARRYRSGVIFNGPLGHNWEFNYNRRLMEDDSGNIVRMDGFGRADTYVLSGGS
ncbi:MAG: DUF6531 domain-containing protein, partial [Dehalococcoidia bacterium]|nr:DUF6531 domain-containing protein [Dehalococcoidia bacterium]